MSYSSLEIFKKNNPTVNYKKIEGVTLVINPWNDDSVQFLFDEKKNLKLLEDIFLPEELVAIFHIKSSILEIIVGPIHKKHSLVGRHFEFNFNGDIYKCYTGEVTPQLKLLAENFITGETLTSSYHRNLPLLRDYFRERIPAELRKEVEPISFFISGNFKDIKTGIHKLLKHLNFYLTYFERKSPSIIILNKKQEIESFTTPCYFTKEKSFPQIINSQIIDPILLDIFSVAHETNDIRLKFIFFYQILEYSSYYYLDNKIRLRLSSLIKSPDLPSKSDDYTKFIIEELKDYFTRREDYQKLEQTIIDHCKVSDIKDEILCNWEYFSHDQEFEGGFKLSAVLKDKNSVSQLVDIDLQKFIKNIDRIRNVIVHLRESRENTVILPTERNNNLLLPYLYLLQRLSELVALRFG